MFEKILNLDKNLSITKLPGSLFTQYFLGKLDVKVFCPIDIPDTKGFIENEPVMCLFNVSNFFLFLNIDVTTVKFLSHLDGQTSGVM